MGDGVKLQESPLTPLSYVSGTVLVNRKLLLRRAPKEDNACRAHLVYPVFDDENSIGQKKIR